MSETRKCIFCTEKADYYGMGPLYTIYKIECPNCGLFVASEIMTQLDQDTLKQYAQYKHLISGLIREKNDLGLRMEIITTENIISLTSDPLIPKTIMQKLDKLLLHYYRNTEYYGYEIRDELEKYSLGYAKNATEYKQMINTLIELNLFSGSFLTGQKYHCSGSLTLDGLTRAEKLLSTNIYSNKVFVAMGFKADLLEAHEKSIQPACKECGFEAGLVSETEYNDDINDRIIAEIKTSKFVVTDFTYNNQGAYFEAGYAQGRGLPVIRTCKKDWFEEVDDKGEKNHLHFDVDHYNIIFWEDHDDLKEKLINRIRATIL